MSTQPIKDERLETRISKDLKNLLEYAAKLRGSSISEFVSQSIEESANEVIRKHQILRLSPRDSEIFIRALLKPPKPNKRLRAALARYKKDVVSR